MGVNIASDCGTACAENISTTCVHRIITASERHVEISQFFDLGIYYDAVCVVRVVPVAESESVSPEFKIGESKKSVRVIGNGVVTGEIIVIVGLLRFAVFVPNRGAFAFAGITERQVGERGNDKISHL